MMTRRAGRLRLGEQQIEEGELPVAVERRGRLVGDDQLRAADQRARRGDALLLADAEVRGREPVRAPRVEARALQQPRGLILGAALARGALAAMRAQSSTAA